MAIPRYRKRDDYDISKRGQVIGKSTSYASFCPRITYRPSTNILYPGDRIDGSEEHCWDEIHKGPPYREGGPLFLIKRSYEHMDRMSETYTYKAYKYEGAFTMDDDPNELDTTFDGYQPTAASYGAEAWNKFRPVKPRSDAGQWIAELRDLPANPWPWKVTAIKNYIRQMKNVGSQYLNIEFGWKPFVRDLQKMYETSKRIENHINYVRKNNNRWLTRGGTIKNSQNVTRTVVGSKSHPDLVTSFYSYYPWTCQRTLIESDHVWFKARCKFYIPDLAGPWNMNTKGTPDQAQSIWSSRLLRKIYGFELTPALAWELIPFSWLQDWVVNVGDVLSNFSNSMYDNLVVKYAYVMRHRKTTLIYDETIPLRVSVPICVGTSFGPTKSKPVNVRSVQTIECKERAHASQWGFGGGGILEEGLTPRQERILTALGISRIR